MREYDIVVAKKKLSNQISEGSIGTIVMIYTLPHEAYEVEFFDRNKESIETITVKKEDIEVLE